MNKIIKEKKQEKIKLLCKSKAEEKLIVVQPPQI
jgi:hypothetical protein